MNSALRTSSIRSSEELGDATTIVLVSSGQVQHEHVLHKKLLMNHCMFFHDYYNTKKQSSTRVWCAPSGAAIRLPGTDHSTFCLVVDFLYDGYVPDLTVTSDEPVDPTIAVNVCCLAIDLGAHELANRIMDRLQCYHFHHVGTSSAHFTLNQIRDILEKTAANSQIWKYCIASIVCRLEWGSYEDSWEGELVALCSQFPVAKESIAQLLSTYEQDISSNNSDYRAPLESTLFTPCHFHDHRYGKLCHTVDSKGVDNQELSDPDSTDAEGTQSESQEENFQEVNATSAEVNATAVVQTAIKQVKRARQKWRKAKKRKVEVDKHYSQMTEVAQGNEPSEAATKALANMKSVEEQIRRAFENLKQKEEELAVARQDVQINHPKRVQKKAKEIQSIWKDLKEARGHLVKAKDQEEHAKRILMQLQTQNNNNHGKKSKQRPVTPKALNKWKRLAAEAGDEVNQMQNQVDYLEQAVKAGEEVKQIQKQVDYLEQTVKAAEEEIKKAKMLAREDSTHEYRHKINVLEEAKLITPSKGSTKVNEHEIEQEVTKEKLLTPSKGSTTSDEENVDRQQSEQSGKGGRQFVVEKKVPLAREEARSRDEDARMAKGIRNSALGHLTWAQNAEKEARQRAKELGETDDSGAITKAVQIRKRAAEQFKLAESQFKSAEKEAARAWNIVMRQAVAQKSTPMKSIDESESCSDDDLEDNEIKLKTDHVPNNDWSLQARMVEAQEEMYRARTLLQRAQTRYDVAKREFSKEGRKMGDGITSEAEVQLIFIGDQLKNATMFVEHTEERLSVVMDEAKRTAGTAGEDRPEKKKRKREENRSSTTNKAFKRGGEAQQGAKLKQKSGKATLRSKPPSRDRFGRFA